MNKNTNNFYGYGFDSSKCDTYVPKDSVDEKINKALKTIKVNKKNELVVGKNKPSKIQDRYVTGITYNKDDNSITVKLNDGSTQKTVIEFPRGTEDTNTFVESAAFDAKNNTLTLSRNDGQEVSVAINIDVPENINDLEGGAWLNESVTTLAGSVTEIRSNVSEISTNVDTVDGKVVALETSVSGLTTSVNEINGTVAALSQNCDEMDEKIDNLFDEDSSIEERLGKLERDIETLQKEKDYLVSLHSTSANTITDMTAEEALTSNVTLTSDEAIAALASPKTFNSIGIIGGTLSGNTDIRLNATESVTMVDTEISGAKGSTNGKVLFTTPSLSVDGVSVAEGSTIYNVFEGSQDKVHLLSTLDADDVVVNDPQLRHNVFNVYQLEDGATIKITDSTFNLNVANSNIMRLSNITNAENVNIMFENIDWTYENEDTTNPSNNAWAGLVIIQPFGADIAHTGDLSKYQTWTMTFKNCRYNGELVDSNNFGTIKQVVYFYDVNKTGGITNPEGTINLVFE